MLRLSKYLSAQTRQLEVIVVPLPTNVVGALDSSDSMRHVVDICPQGPKRSQEPPGSARPPVGSKWKSVGREKISEYLVGRSA